LQAARVLLALPRMTWNGIASCVLVTCMVVSASAGADPHDGDTKSAEIATTLAIGGSVIGPALLAMAIQGDRAGPPLDAAVIPLLVSGSAVVVLGPSAGNWYAHKGLSAGLALRAAGCVSLLIGGSLVASELFSTDTGASGVVGVGLGIAGIGALATGTVLDIVEAHRSVNTYNREHAVRRLSIAPVVAWSNGVRHGGLAIAGSF
jgi:hypothetical protein